MKVLQTKVTSLLNITINLINHEWYIFQWYNVKATLPVWFIIIIIMSYYELFNCDIVLIIGWNSFGILERAGSVLTSRIKSFGDFIFNDSLTERISFNTKKREYY